MRNNLIVIRFNAQGNLISCADNIQFVSINVLPFKSSSQRSLLLHLYGADSRGLHGSKNSYPNPKRPVNMPHGTDPDPYFIWKWDPNQCRPEKCLKCRLLPGPNADPIQGRRHGGAWGGVAPSLGLSRPLTQDECENRFYLWNIMVYLKNTVAKRIGFLALIWYYSKHLGQSVSQSRILITSDTQTSRTSSSTKCRHYAALLTKLKVWWNIFLMFNRGLDYRS